MGDNCKHAHLFWYNSDDLPEVDEKFTLHKVKTIEVFGDDEMMQGVKINDVETITLDGLFIEGEPKPVNTLIKDHIELIDGGYIKVDEGYLTSKNNIYAVGDVTGKSSSYMSALDEAKKVAGILNSKLKK